MQDSQWQPTASLETLQQAATLKRLVREYMQEAGVLEVSTPVISKAAATDPQLQSCELTVCGESAYLHTSPEFPMKRLLAMYQQDIYQMVPVFRDAERGHRHNPEFTMIEWYRMGMDHRQLMQSIVQLLETLCDAFHLSFKPPLIKTYRDLIEAEVGSDMPSITLKTIQSYFQKANRSFPDTQLSLDAALDLLMDTFVLPKFHPDEFVFIADYPASQAALAQISVDDTAYPVASRFELYRGSLEIANGYHELTDADQLKRRMESDQQLREQLGLPPVAPDALMVDAHLAGLPNCAGVAVGFERLLMALSQTDDINQVLAFPFERA